MPAKGNACKGKCLQKAMLARGMPGKATPANGSAGNARQPRCANWKQSLAGVVCAHPLLMDTRVCRGVVSTCMFDWMHVYCVNGLVSDEVALFMCEMKAKAKTLHVDPITFDKVHTYMQTWRWPRALASAHNLCNSKSAHTGQENNSFGGTAS